MRRLLSLVAVFALCSAAPAQTLELKKGEHVCIIGNTLADRMQHFGWLETLIQARFPQHELVFRSLGYSGDEVAGVSERAPLKLLRGSSGFRSPRPTVGGGTPRPT